MPGRGATVTLLFSDLVDSTMLLERVGDVRGQRIFAAHHALLSDAVQCALAMQRAARQPIDGERLPIRVGLHIGEALIDEADWFGMPVVIARRLCDRAVGGQILCTDVVRGVLASHYEFVFAPAGELALMGLRDPVAAFSVSMDDDEPARAEVARRTGCAAAAGSR